MADVDTLALRYIDIGNDTDPTGRRAAVEDLWAPDADRIDPMVEARGHDLDIAVTDDQGRLRSVLGFLDRVPAA